MLAELNPQFWWWVVRSTGIVAWALVTASILWGLTLSSKLIRRKGIPAWLLDLHRYLGTLSMVFTGLHLASLVADNFLYFGPRELFIPGESSYRPHAVTWGIIALYMLVAIQITSWLMRRMPRRVWHTIHLLSFPTFIAATTHGYLAGADRNNMAVQWAALTGITWVLFLVIFRLLAPKRAESSSRIPAAARERLAAQQQGGTSPAARPQRTAAIRTSPPSAVPAAPRREISSGTTATAERPTPPSRGLPPPLPHPNP
jgi:DMSO/TMAO reductase YedYZ heme-binding membrane subunit